VKEGRNLQKTHEILPETEMKKGALDAAIQTVHQFYENDE
jgi:hypothetical protein